MIRLLVKLRWRIFIKENTRTFVVKVPSVPSHVINTLCMCVWGGGNLFMREVE